MENVEWLRKDISKNNLYQLKFLHSRSLLLICSFHLPSTSYPKSLCLVIHDVWRASLATPKSTRWCYRMKECASSHGLVFLLSLGLQRLPFCLSWTTPSCHQSPSQSQCVPCQHFHYCSLWDMCICQTRIWTCRCRCSQIDVAFDIFQNIQLCKLSSVYMNSFCIN